MKLKSSIVAIIALSSMSFAGGDLGGVTTFENEDYVAADIEAVEPKKPAPKVVEVKKPTPKPIKPVVATAGPLYLGGALSLMATRIDDRANLFGDEDFQDRQIGLTGVIGYDFMDYLGAELRASMGVSEDKTDKMKHVGLYLKPKIKVMGDSKSIKGGLNLYGLLGYAQSNMSDTAKFTGSNSGFSYGAGLDYGITENISIFTDAVNYLKDSDTNSQWGANLGVKYNF
jgi:hypothetical protein